MKARVKATGEIVEVSMECNNSTNFKKATFRTKNGVCYRYDDIELIFDKIKARVKSTGDIFEVSDTTTIYPEHYDKSYNITEVEFLDVKEKSFAKDDDYWTRLEHTYAGMAMQGICSSDIIMEKINRINAEGDKFGVLIAELSANLAHALVEKLKEMEERK